MCPKCLSDVKRQGKTLAQAAGRTMTARAHADIHRVFNHADSLVEKLTFSSLAYHTLLLFVYTTSRLQLVLDSAKFAYCPTPRAAPWVTLCLFAQHGEDTREQGSAL